MSDGVTAAQLVLELESLLRGAGVPHPRAEGRDILAALLDVARHWPSANPRATVADDVAGRAREAGRRRVAGEPFAYAVGRAAFRHLTLVVDWRVLIPRQETEILVEIVLGELECAEGGTAVDVGTGSGAIALALASESRLDRIVATDVSGDALAVAAGNVERLRARLTGRVELRQGAGLAPVRGEQFAVVVSNPPYIAFAEAASLPPSVRDWEPPLALYSGDGGMSLTAELLRDAAPVLLPGGLLAVELDSRRVDAAARLARDDGRYEGVTIHPDMTGRGRILTARRTPGHG